MTGGHSTTTGREPEETLVESHAGGRPSTIASPQPPQRGDAIARYVILSEIGRGGMGTVYAAYDPDLDRKVALKLVRGGGGRGPEAAEAARARTVREARALAKLAHPNVVAIHDVGEYRDGLWIAMEFVDGRTLSSWLAAESRAASEVLDVMIRVGQGVAAAHAAGVLHRDLKPDNVMIDATGRVRVLDFGLARAESAPADDDPTTSAERDVPVEDRITRVGAWVGTPGYMAPEQFDTGAITAAADQFSFCVTVWEALCGVRPFTGDAPAEVLVSIHEGTPRGSAGMPAAVRRVLQRGLAREPSARWPSMNDLLAALDSGRRRRHVRVVTAGALALVLGTVGVLATVRLAEQRRIDACARDGESIAALWPGRQDAVEMALAGAQAGFVRTTAEKVAPWLDDYAGRWSDARAAACVATEDAAGELAVRARQCLDERAAIVQTLLDRLEQGDEEAAVHAVELVAALPPIDTCGDEARLAREPWPGEDRRERVLDLRGRLAAAQGLRAVGDLDGALEATSAIVEEAAALGWAPLESEARTERSAVLHGLARYDEAERELVDAYFAAAKVGADGVAARAAMGLTASVGLGLARYGEGLQWAEHASVMFERAGESGGLTRTRLDMLRASLHRERREYAEAQRLQRHVLDEYERRLGPEHPYVADVLNNLGNTMFEIGQPKESLALLRRALDIRERSLGSEHPDIAASAMNLAYSERANGHAAEALALGERALAVAEQALGPEHPAVAASLATLAALVEDSQPERAHSLLERAIAIEEAVLGVDHPDVGESRMSLAVMLGKHGELEAGLAEQRRALAIFERHDPNDVRVAMALHNLAHRDQDRGALAEALPQLERALAIVERSPETRPTLTGRIRLRLARLRRDLGQPELARPHVEAALAALEPGTDAALEQGLRELADELRDVSPAAASSPPRERGSP